MRVLIVDDEPTLLTAMQDYLMHCGWRVDCAQELEEAQALLSNFHYEVVITDMRLSQLQQAEGLQVIGFLRDRGIDSRLIVITAYASDDVQREASRLGIDRLLRKPYPLAEIARLVNELGGGLC